LTLPYPKIPDSLAAFRVPGGLTLKNRNPNNNGPKKAEGTCVRAEIKKSQTPNQKKRNWEDFGLNWIIQNKLSQKNGANLTSSSHLKEKKNHNQ